MENWKIYQIFFKLDGWLSVRISLLRLYEKTTYKSPTYVWILTLWLVNNIAPCDQIKWQFRKKMVCDHISIWKPRLKITRLIPNLMPNLCLFRLMCWCWSIQSLIVEDFMWQASARHPRSRCECALVVGELGQRFIMPPVTAMKHNSH